MATATKKPTKSSKADAPSENGTERKPVEKCFLEWNANVDMLRDSIIQMVHGNEHPEPMYEVEKYSVTRNLDGSVELLLGLRNDTSKPFDHIRIRIEHVDN